MFETTLNIHSCYVIYCKSIAIESRYLKPTFKSEKSSIGTLKSIVSRLKDLVHFLKKKNCINSDIYIN